MGIKVRELMSFIDKKCKLEKLLKSYKMMVGI